MPMIGARFYTQLDNIQSRTDVLENEVSKEMENGRLFRLMVKLGTINERPEYINKFVGFTNPMYFVYLDLTWMELGVKQVIDTCLSYLGIMFFIK